MWINDWQWTKLVIFSPVQPWHLCSPTRHFINVLLLRWALVTICLLGMTRKVSCWSGLLWHEPCPALAPLLTYKTFSSLPPLREPAIVTTSSADLYSRRTVELLYLKQETSEKLWIFYGDKMSLSNEYQYIFIFIMLVKIILGLWMVL